MNLDAILSRLEKVRRTGNNQYIACCPAHDDRSPSLSIKDAGDGKILINCLAGCSTENVIGAIGLDWEDIMPPKQTEHVYKPQKQRIYATDALRAIQLEARIVTMAAFELRKNKPLAADDIARLELAMERINTAVEMANVSN